MNRDREGRTGDDLRARTKQFALRVVRLYAALPTTVVGQTIGKQALRSGTSVGAHYREACRARSDAEFVAKLEGGLMELEETAYWLELVVEAGLLPAERLADLLHEADELTAILTASVKTVKARPRRSQHSSLIIPHSSSPCLPSWSWTTSRPSATPSGGRSATPT